jgi:uncharacterized protein (DUF1778 family)
MTPPTATEKQSAKKERFEARLTPEQKRHIEQAARIKGISLSDFVIGSAEEAAVRTIRDYEVLALNDRARAVFVHALLNPPKPSPRLVAAVKRYKTRK